MKQGEALAAAVSDARAELTKANAAFWKGLRECPETLKTRACNCTDRYADAIAAAKAVGAAVNNEECFWSERGGQ